MPYESVVELPKGVKDNLPHHAQEIYLAAFNSALEEYGGGEDRARRVAWAAVKKGGYAKDEGTGDWKKK
ncbi:MAG TPA: ChaB family protein [Terriglobales bacterium]|nr:ChaB family protein [Terriglobales bacterium]